MIRERIVSSNWPICGMATNTTGAPTEAALSRISAKYFPNNGQAASSQYSWGTSRRIVHSKLLTFIFLCVSLGGAAPGAVVTPAEAMGSPKSDPSTRELERALSQRVRPVERIWPRTEGFPAEEGACARIE